MKGGGGGVGEEPDLPSPPLPLSPSAFSPSALLLRQWDRRRHTGLIPVRGRGVALAGGIFN